MFLFTFFLYYVLMDLELTDLKYLNFTFMLHSLENFQFNFHLLIYCSVVFMLLSNTNIIDINNYLFKKSYWAIFHIPSRWWQPHYDINLHRELSSSLCPWGEWYFICYCLSEKNKALKHLCFYGCAPNRHSCFLLIFFLTS